MQFSEKIEKIKENQDIVIIIEKYVNLKRAGNIFKGLCPFHDENTPSFVVSAAKQSYKCFGCGAGGDVISFIQRIHYIPFVEAIKKLDFSFEISDDWKKSDAYKTKYIPKIELISFIDFDIFNKSLNNYDNNNFTVYLNNKFGKNVSESLISKYHIGTSKRFLNSTIFWQIDAQERIRTGKIMQYDANTLKRVKEPKTCIGWVHSNIPNFHLQQCFFGEHLLSTELKTKTVCICESEKSAIVGTAFYPEYIWLASGSKDALKSKIWVLRGRTVILYPDAQAYLDWLDIANDWKGIINISVSSLIEENATDEEYDQKVDLADYLLK